MIDSTQYFTGSFSRLDPLPYATKPIQTAHGLFEEYIIPDEDRKEIFLKLWPYGDEPALDEWREDIINGAKFRLRDFRVTREGNMTCLVSPFYEETGSTVVNWW